MALYLKKPALICIVLVVCLYLYLSKNNDKTETDDYYDKDCDYIQEQYEDPDKSSVDGVERIEENFCRNPQTCWDEEKYCSSILHFFTMLRNGCGNFVAGERENNLGKGKFRRQNNGGNELVDDFKGNSDVEMCKLNKEGDEKISKSFCSRNGIDIQEINDDEGNTEIREKVGKTGNSTDAILTHGNVDNLNLINSTLDDIDDKPKFNEDDGENSLKRNGEDEILDDDDDIEGMTKKDVEDDDTKTVDEDKENMSLAYLVLFSLLVMSTAASLLELLRERKRRKVLEETADDGNENGAGFSSGRRMSLVDLTVSRHARKEQQIESIIKHSGSSRAPPPPLLRRCSFPAQAPEGQGQSQGQKPASPKRQLTWSPPSLVRQTSRRLSVDYGDDDSPDRRRVRIIRRH